MNPTIHHHLLYPLGLTNAQPLDGMAMPAGENTSAGIAALTKRLAAGDEAAFREFHAQYFDRLHQFLLVVARGKEDEAREALQETLLRVAKHCKPFDNETVFWCWLKAIARNAARDAGRKRTRYAGLLEKFSRFIKPPAPSAPAKEDGRLTTIIEECLQELAELDRALLQDKYLTGCTVNELALKHDLSAKAVESRLLRLRRELRGRVLLKLRHP